MNRCDIPGCCHCYTNRRCRTQLPGHRYYIHPAVKRRYTVGQYTDKVPDAARLFGMSESLQMTPWGAAHPAVCEYLSDTGPQGGPSRETTTIMVLCDDHRLKAWINDRANKRSGWVTEETWEGLWDLIERKLAAGGVEWRSSRDLPKKFK